jgi:hypothetical protein
VAAASKSANMGVCLPDGNTSAVRQMCWKHLETSREITSVGKLLCCVGGHHIYRIVVIGLGSPSPHPEADCADFPATEVCPALVMLPERRVFALAGRYVTEGFRSVVREMKSVVVGSTDG